MIKGHLPQLREATASPTPSSTARKGERPCSNQHEQNPSQLIPPQACFTVRVWKSVASKRFSKRFFLAAYLRTRMFQEGGGPLKLLQCTLFVCWILGTTGCKFELTGVGLPAFRLLLERSATQLMLLQL